MRKPSRWKFVTADPTLMQKPEVQKLADDALAAVPHGFVSNEDVLEHLPRQATHGRCRLCGKTSQLTREHIPPRASGNKERHQHIGFDEWIRSNDPDSLSGGKIEQGGVFGYTLCRECNSFTGLHYGDEYRKWADAAKRTLSVVNPAALDKEQGPFGCPVKFGSDVDLAYPDAFVRQILSCMCSLSGTWDLASTHPEVRSIILDASTDSLPNGLDLSFALFLGATD